MKPTKRVPTAVRTPRPRAAAVPLTSDGLRANDPFIYILYALFAGGFAVVGVMAYYLMS